MLPLNAFEQVQLLNTVPMPNWTYRTLFLPNDSTFKAADTMCLDFVRPAKGMERNTLNIHKSHNVVHVTSPLKDGGLRLH